MRMSICEIVIQAANYNLSNFREEPPGRIKSATFKNTLSVLNAAGRWRRKHRRMSARPQSSAKVKIRAVSASPSNTFFSVVKQIYWFFFRNG